MPSTLAILSEPKREFSRDERLKPGIIYVYVAGDLAYHGRYSLATAYLGYAFANIGLFFAAKT